jgi:hypothetical protein
MINNCNILLYRKGIIGLKGEDIHKLANGMRGNIYKSMNMSSTFTSCNIKPMKLLHIEKINPNPII